MPADDRAATVGLDRDFHSGGVSDEGEQRFRVMADHAPVMLWMADPNAECTFFNRGWLEFRGETMEHELGVGWADGVHFEDFQHCMHTYLSAFVSREPFRMEYRLRRADGEYRWILDTGVPRLDAAGSFAGYIGSCIDITEIREAHDAQKRHQAELERLVAVRTAEIVQRNEELEAFSFSVSHDLRAPLRSILGFSQAFLEEHGSTIDDEGRDLLDRVRESAQRMAELIDALLRLSRLTRGDYRAVDVDLSVITREVVATLRAGETDREVEVVIEGDLRARGDPDLIRVMLENLVGNAWKFTTRVATPRVEVGVVRLEGDRAFFVRDNGAGFDPAAASTLFAPFRRLHHATEFPGTGIGLATVKRIVQRHGGRVWAESEKDRGAAFYFTLPAQGVP